MITNDPWLCHGQLTDLIIVVPLFAGARPIAYVPTVAHVSEWVWRRFRQSGCRWFGPRSVGARLGSLR